MNRERTFSLYVPFPAFCVPCSFPLVADGFELHPFVLISKPSDVSRDVIFSYDLFPKGLFRLPPVAKVATLEFGKIILIETVLASVENNHSQSEENSHFQSKKPKIYMSKVESSISTLCDLNSAVVYLYQFARASSVA